jgi:hypothetical protein
MLRLIKRQTRNARAAARKTAVYWPSPIILAISEKPLFDYCRGLSE